MTEPNLGKLEFDLNEKPVVMLGISTDGNLLTIECTPEPKASEKMSARLPDPGATDLHNLGILPVELTDANRFLLFNVLTTYYDLQDIRTLVFWLEISYDELAGEAKQAKVVSLLEYCFKHRMLKKLFEHVRMERPDPFK